MGFVAGLSHDLRYGLRVLVASRTYTFVAVVSLTLGIGVATSAFSEMNGFILRDVPAISAPGQLVLLAGPVSYPDYLRYRRESDLLSGTLAYLAPVPFAVEIAGQTQRLWGHIVTPSYFPTLGVQPASGRFFDAREEQPGGEPRVVISDAFWRNRLGSPRGIVGSSLRINGQACTVVGIAPPDFQGASPMVYGADLWLPVTAPPAIAPELAGNLLEQRDRAVFHVLARLRPGVPQASAEAAWETVARRIEEETSDPSRLRKGRRIEFLPGGKLIPVRKQDLPMFTAFFTILGGMILLIAGANVATMTLARGAARRKEIAVRLALGAGRGRLVRQLLTESLIIAAAAGFFGFLMAVWLMHLASGIRMPYPMPLTLNLAPDARVLWFTLGLTGFTALAFGLVPALQATRPGLTSAIKEGSGLVQPRHSRLPRLRSLLMVSQVAASLALLLITGFLVIGHRRIADVAVGFETRNLYLISLDPVRDGYSAARSTDFLDKLLDRVKALPSVASATLADAVPMTMIGKPAARFFTDEPASGRKVLHSGRRYTVGRDFFDTLGISIVRGRGFRHEDEADSSAVAVVSEKLVRECWKGEDPIGRSVEIGDEEIPSFSPAGGAEPRPGLRGRPRTVQVIGVARNVRDGLVMVPADAPGVVYLPLRPAALAQPSLQGVTLAIRAVPGVDAVAAVRREISAMDDRIQPFNIRAMPEQIEQLMFPVRSALWTYAFIGMFGLILASVGLAGLTAYSVAQRRREIGIRIAVGARSRDVLRLVMREGAVLTGTGTIFGLVFARFGIRVLSASLGQIARTAGTSISDPALLIGAPLLLGSLALVACYLPARRSARVDPLVVLRSE